MSTGARSAALVAVLGVLVIGAVTAGLLVASSEVEVRVDGETLVTRTLAGDVAGVLDRLGVDVDDADRIEPAPPTPVSDGQTVVITRASSVEVRVDDRPAETVVAVASTVADVLRAGGLENLLEGEARIDPAPDAPVADGARVIVELPRTVTVTADGREHELATYAVTVGEALADAGVRLRPGDRVDADPDDPLEPATSITVRRIEVVDEVTEVEMAFDEERIETEELPDGETRVETEGRAGITREIHEVTLVDGEESERELVDEELVREPTARVVLVGTGPSPVEEAQQLLSGLGLPVGRVDGIEGPQTRRALCAWRRFEGREVSRGPLQPEELDALREASGLPDAPAGRGVTADRTCQTLSYREGGAWRHVYEASTGSDGLPREGSYRIQRTRSGWHTSSLYPAPEPNMYNTLYIRGAIAIHGSNHVPPHPASAGCVRVTPEAADQLFADLSVGDPVQVVGSY